MIVDIGWTRFCVERLADHDQRSSKCRRPPKAMRRIASSTWATTSSGGTMAAATEFDRARRPLRCIPFAVMTNCLYILFWYYSCE